MSQPLINHATSVVFLDWFCLSYRLVRFTVVPRIIVSKPFVETTAITSPA